MEKVLQSQRVYAMTVRNYLSSLKCLHRLHHIYSPDGPMLELEVLGDLNNFVDLQRTRLNW